MGFALHTTTITGHLRVRGGLHGKNLLPNDMHWPHTRWTRVSDYRGYNEDSIKNATNAIDIFSMF